MFNYISVLIIIFRIAMIFLEIKQYILNGINELQFQEPISNTSRVNNIQLRTNIFWKGLDLYITPHLWVK